MRQIAKSLFEVQYASIVIDIIKFNIWLKGLLIFKVHNGTSMETIATSNFVVLTKNEK